MYKYDTWTGDGTQDTLNYSRLTLQHLSFCDIKVCIPAWKKSVSIVCDQEMTASFTSALVVNRLASRSFVRDIKSWKTLGRYCHPDSFRRCGRRLGTILPTVPILWSVISISLDPLWSTWLKSDLQQSPTWSNPSFPDCRLLKLFSSTPVCNLWWNEISAKMSMITTWRSDLYHLLPTCHIYIEFRMNSLASECLLHYY
jgi:hypothetical protein